MVQSELGIGFDETAVNLGNSIGLLSLGSGDVRGCSFGLDLIMGNRFDLFEAFLGHVASFYWNFSHCLQGFLLKAAKSFLNLLGSES